MGKTGKQRECQGVAGRGLGGSAVVRWVWCWAVMVDMAGTGTVEEYQDIETFLRHTCPGDICFLVQ